MTSSLPYERATAGDKALHDLQRTLQAFGCSSFGTMVDAEHGSVIVAFRWRERHVQLEASWHGYAQAWLKRNPWSGSRARISKQQYEQRAYQQARTSVCSVLRDWARAQTTAIECGVMSFEAAFLPHMLLRDGRRVLDAARPSLTLAGETDLPPCAT